MDWWWMITLGLWLGGPPAPVEAPVEVLAEATADEPQVEVSPELEAMAEAEQDAFAAEAWEPPDRDEHCRWEGMQQPVLDPFGGSGTTYDVCERTRRYWIGIEKESCGVIIERLSSAVICPHESEDFVEGCHNA